MSHKALGCYWFNKFKYVRLIFLIIKSLRYQNDPLVQQLKSLSAVLNVIKWSRTRSLILWISSLTFSRSAWSHKLNGLLLACGDFLALCVLMYRYSWDIISMKKLSILWTIQQLNIKIFFILILTSFGAFLLSFMDITLPAQEHMFILIFFHADWFN